MSDAICSMLASLFTSMPNTTFSQNNGVIAMTKCASRRAGLATGFWLILMGVLAKFAGIITSIPDCGKSHSSLLLTPKSFIKVHIYIDISLVWSNGLQSSWWHDHLSLRQCFCVRHHPLWKPQREEPPHSLHFSLILGSRSRGYRLAIRFPGYARVVVHGCLLGVQRL